MRKLDWFILLLLILLSPIWIPVALLGGLWFLVVSIFSRLRLPDMIGAPLGMAWMVLMVPLYPFLLLTHAAFGQLFRERLVVDNTGITIRALFKTKQISWREIKQVVEVFSPPVNTYKFVFNNGEELALGAFADNTPVLEAALSHGVQVRRRPIPGQGTPRDESTLES